jgi:lipoprotein-anchoring transpeptidase ErfK/SrfK
MFVNKTIGIGTGLMFACFSGAGFAGYQGLTQVDTDETFTIPPQPVINSVMAPQDTPTFIPGNDTLIAAKSNQPLDFSLNQQPLLVKVSLAERKVYVMSGEQVIKSYPATIGKASTPTPPGSFTIQSKYVNPAYKTSNGVTIPANDPNNPLGSRWMQFQGDENTFALGFHEETNPSRLGSMDSQGCVRLLENDLIDLYNTVDINTPVLIQ